MHPPLFFLTYAPLIPPNHLPTFTSPDLRSGSQVREKYSKKDRIDEFKVMELFPYRNVWLEIGKN